MSWHKKHAHAKVGSIGSGWGLRYSTINTNYGPNTFEHQRSRCTIIHSGRHAPARDRWDCGIGEYYLFCPYYIFCLFQMSYQYMSYCRHHYERGYCLSEQQGDVLLSTLCTKWCIPSQYRANTLGFSPICITHRKAAESKHLRCRQSAKSLTGLRLFHFGVSSTIPHDCSMPRTYINCQQPRTVR